MKKQRPRIMIANVDGRFVPVHTKTATVAVWSHEIKVVSLSEMTEKMSDEERKAYRNQIKLQNAKAIEEKALRKEAEKIVEQRRLRADEDAREMTFMSSWT